jgi:hypothetical protein
LSVNFHTDRSIDVFGFEKKIDGKVTVDKERLPKELLLSMTPDELRFTEAMVKGKILTGANEK